MRELIHTTKTSAAQVSDRLWAIVDTRARLAILAVTVVFGVIAGGTLPVAVGLERGAGPTRASAAAGALDEANLEERETVERAAKRAKRLGRPVEALELRTDTRSVFVHPAGRRSAKIYAGPVRVKERGRWRPLDVNLVSRGDEVRPKAAAADLSLSDGADRSLARLQGERGSLGLTWKGDRLPEPELAGADAVYRDVEPGVDIVVQAGPQGFQQRVVVDDASKRPLVLRFGLELGGLTARLTEQGRLELRDQRGERVAVADPAHMWGSEVGRRSQEPLEQARVATRLVEQGSEQIMELRPDPAFLRSVEGPVTIEPAANLTTTGDTYVSSDWPSATYGGATELKSGSYNGRNRHRSLVRFPGGDDGPSQGLGGIPRDAVVTSAVMQLYNHWSWSCRPRVTEVYRVAREWGVNSASWSNQPTVGARYGAVSHAKGYSSACPAGVVGFPITELARKWVSESVPNYGVRLQPQNEATRDTYSWRKFRTANYSGGSRAPYLVVNYESSGS